MVWKEDQTGLISSTWRKLQNTHKDAVSQKPDKTPEQTWLKVRWCEWGTLQTGLGKSVFFIFCSLHRCPQISHEAANQEPLNKSLRLLTTACLTTNLRKALNHSGQGYPRLHLLHADRLIQVFLQRKQVQLHTGRRNLGQTWGALSLCGLAGCHIPDQTHRVFLLTTDLKLTLSLVLIRKSRVETESN